MILVGECDACVLQNSAILMMNSGYYVRSLPELKGLVTCCLSLASLYLSRSLSLTPPAQSSCAFPVPEREVFIDWTDLNLLNL